MLVTGEIDALYAPRTPRPLLEGRRRSAAVRRPQGREEQYAAETGIFPIMHVVVLRREVYQARPWLAPLALHRVEAGQGGHRQRMGETAANRYMLPWLYDEVSGPERLLGETSGHTGSSPTGRPSRCSCDTRRAGPHARRLRPGGAVRPETWESYVI